MHILYIVHQFLPDHHTGTEMFTYRLARSMQANGHRVTVMDAKANAVRSFDGLSILPPGPVPTSPKPDLVHLMHAKDAQRTLLQDLVLGSTPYLVTLTDFFLLCPHATLVTKSGEACEGPAGGTACTQACPEYLQRSIRKRLEASRELLTGATDIIAPSQFLAGVFSREWPAIRVRVIPYGLPPATTLPEPEPGAIRFLYAGSITRHKGVDLLIEAFQKVNDPDIELHIHGTGYDQAFVQELKDRCQADPRIHWNGPYKPKDLASVFRNRHVTVIPSQWPENTPIVMLESQAHGVPVLGADVPGIREAATGHDRFFEAGNAEALVDGLRAVIEDLHPPEVHVSATHRGELHSQTAYAYRQLYMRMTQ